MPMDVTCCNVTGKRRLKTMAPIDEKKPSGYVHYHALFFGAINRPTAVALICAIKRIEPFLFFFVFFGLRIERTNTKPGIDAFFIARTSAKCSHHDR